MRVSWNDPLSYEFDELILETLATEGEPETLRRLLVKLDEVPLATRRDFMYLLTLIPSDEAIAWLEARIESPVVESWGRLAALLGIHWARIATWLKRGRPLSLAALDALVAYAHPHPGSSLLQRAVQPLLSDPPSLETLREALDALAMTDDAPRVTKTVHQILELASEILRGGQPTSTTPRRFYEQEIARRHAQHVAWAEASRPLPDPKRHLVADASLRAVWQRRWNAAVEACQRLGGEGSVTLGPPMTKAELAAVELELGAPIPSSLAALFLGVARDVDVCWFLPDGCVRPVAFKEVGWGSCRWDARRLPDLERSRRGWLEAVFPNVENEYDRVWHHKFSFHDVPNGDLIAVDISRGDSAPVVYLSHDDGEGHGRVLGHSVLDFIDRWTLLGCVGPEDWSMMPFLLPGEPYLDPTGEVARNWRAWFGIDEIASG